MTDARPHFGPGDDWPSHDTPRRYRKTAVVLMLRMPHDFNVSNREGENMQGRAGDYLVADGHGGWYACSAEFHRANYQPVADNDTEDERTERRKTIRRSEDRNDWLRRQHDKERRMAVYDRRSNRWV